MYTESLELDFDNIPGSISELMDSHSTLQQDIVELEAILHRFERGDTDLSYPEIEEFRYKIEEAIEVSKVLLDALEQAIAYKSRSRSSTGGAPVS